ncbi:hypothetical protein [Pseudoalteromonas luteoviolacea]|uniref:Solute-binding protein family 3/N-terminal domain-containing protein n=1 Tax=Pseudoalteromonas luteoviolacea S4054 TaxID=1129367 RepID=A0A0F6A737_9GAMM|nr:hypothetical protein [Pseudoalteromonas luteoviolacea]AOT10706.1 hypothetical protein S4054249_22890 [Pseudoalteromonas luteoviolacea]AOT16132.1 hypothetical protein S40542_25620 [Pseudoalteromonas luteoviolacea]AOT20526.1 hypothetical protein S4054_22805 [Pseudoalteromonas luteoviolacea]KKE81234.1 hypothetical protein N479_22920 [Pseudoalteromonas luteoviolacea S4054]KZN69003.1 hypothetical protein N481_22940 [Pseudoalteromonas luteoviolacea S4047-1]
MSCSDKLALVMLVAACTFCVNVNAHGVHIYLDDQLDFELLSSKVKQPENIAGATNLLVLSKIDDMVIHYVKSSRKRAIKSLQQSNVAACNINMIKNEQRKREYLFSLPVNFYWAHKLYSHHDLSKAPLPVLNMQNEISSLPALFKSYNQTAIVIAENFSYGDFLDAQLDEIAPKNLIFRGGADHYETVYRMFISKRVDFLLNYPAEFHRYSNNVNLSVRSYRIAGSPKIIVGHFMCNKTEVSREFISKVNQVLLNIYDKPSFLNAHFNYLPKKEHQDLKAFIEQYFMNISHAD